MLIKVCNWNWAHLEPIVMGTIASSLEGITYVVCPECKEKITGELDRLNPNLKRAASWQRRKDGGKYERRQN